MSQETGLANVGRQLTTGLLGSVPSTRSPGMFVGDLLGSFTDPQGVLGQMGRLTLTLAAADRGGVGGALGMQNFFRREDERKMAQKEIAAAQNLTPEQYFQKFMEEYKGPVKPADAPAITDEDLQLGTPSMGEQVIDHPVDPELQAKMRRDQILANRLTPEGLRGSGAMTGALAQNAGLPSNAFENTALTEKIAGNVDIGKYNRTDTITEQGLKSVVSPKDPEDMFFNDQEIAAYQSTLPEYMDLVKIPAPPAPDGTPRWKGVGVRKPDPSLSFLDLAMAKAGGDPSRAFDLMMESRKSGTGKVDKNEMAAAQHLMVNDLELDDLTPGEWQEIVGESAKLRGGKAFKLPDPLTAKQYEKQGIPLPVPPQQRINEIIAKAKDRKFAPTPEQVNAQAKKETRQMLKDEVYRQRQSKKQEEKGEVRNPAGAIFDFLGGIKSPGEQLKSVQKNENIPQTPTAFAAPEIDSKEVAKEFMAAGSMKDGTAALRRVYMKMVGSPEQKVRKLQEILGEMNLSPPEAMEIIKLVLGGK